MFVKPAPGLCIRDPLSLIKAALPAEGAEVPASTYWLRRLQDGDVVSAVAPSLPAVVTPKQIPPSEV